MDVTHRIQVIGDELLGVGGEAATLFSELVLCENPSRPVQFAISASVRYPLSSVLSRAPSDIFGKLAERIVLGLGLHDLKTHPEPDAVFARYKALVDEILSKTASILYVLTVPREAFPECAPEVAAFNERLKSLEGDRVRILDFALHVENFERDQVLRGKFARSLYDSNGMPTSLCHTLLGLFIERRIFNLQKESDNESH